MATIIKKDGKVLIKIADEDIVSTSLLSPKSSSNKPQMVYHYTSINTFEKILASRSLRFTNLRDVNDTSEYYYGLELLIDKISTYENRRGIKLEKRIPHAFLRHIFFTDCLYNASFTENGDDLVFWNSHYIDKNKAVAIGFETAKLESDKYILNHCIYGDPYPKDMDANTYMMFRDFYLHPESISKDLRFIKMTFDIAHIKNKVFEPEKEWRLIFLPSMKMKYCQFKRENKICRYFDIPFNIEALTKVVVGPAGANIYHNLELVNDIVRKSSINIKIDYSKIPLDL